MRTVIIGAAILACSASLPAFAQAERPPATSRSEAFSTGINNSLSLESRARIQAQQNQFEINSLRNENAIRSPAPIIVPPPVVAPVR